VEAEVPLDIVSSWQAVASREPSPEEAAMVVDDVERLMAMLAAGDREILTRLLQGERQAEIAAALGRSERTVRRSLHRIRDRLNELQQSAAPDVTMDAVGTSATRVLPLSAPSPAVHGATSDIEPTIEYSELVLQQLIGQGGFGKVYRASRTSDGTQVAVKFLKKQFWKDERSVQCMLEETMRVSSLSHPHIIRHYGWGRTQRGAVFIAMEWIDGSDVTKWRQNAQPSVAEIIECGLAIADGLAAAHAAHIIHGDVTPGNILRRHNGTFLLTDFGFAQSLSDSRRPRLGGTPGFLAPEQVSDAFGPSSERTDVYGLGGLLYALWTGRPPVTGRDVPEIIANVLSSKPPQPPGRFASESSPELEEILLACLRKEPAERPASVATVRNRLQAIQRD
jgi:hypothetical protein